MKILLMVFVVVGFSALAEGATPNPTPGAEYVEPLPTPREVEGSEHTGAGTSGGPAGYTGTGRGGTVGERGNDTNTEPSQLEVTPGAPRQ
jgi:hypothetical protein